MPRSPRKTLLELNARLWLEEQPWAGSPPDLARVPEEQIRRWADLGIQWIWMMGVWEPSPAGRLIAQSIDGLVGEIRSILPRDFTMADVLASPYAVRDYKLNPALGRPDAPGRPGSLTELRRRLNEQGIRLMLDFVPNHTATDHPWVEEHPDYYVQGTGEEYDARPHDFFATNDGRVIACGRDPYFAPWTDTAQLNYLNPDTRMAMTRRALEVAEWCDGLRCDMAMLATNDVFHRVWGERVRANAGSAGRAPDEADARVLREEFWVQFARALRASRPDFVLMAEVYWDMERDLRNMGFDFTYDKALYDHMVHGDWRALRGRLTAGSGFHAHNVHFVENHDEPRARVAFGERVRPAAALAASIPGVALHHQGQWDGLKIKWPVQLGRDPREEGDPELRAWHEGLLKELAGGVWTSGDFDTPFVRSCWRGPHGSDETWVSVFAVMRRAGDEIGLLVVNLGWDRARARVDFPPAREIGVDFRFADPLTGDVYDRDGAELARDGLFVELEPGGLHLFRATPHGGG